MKGKTLLLLALAMSMALVFTIPLAKASPTSIEIIFDDTGTSSYDPCPLPVGSKFDVTLHVTGVPDPGAVQWMVRIRWDPAVLNLTKKPTKGPWLSQDGLLDTTFLVKPIDYVGGNIPEMTERLMEAGSTSGSGDLAYMAPSFEIMSFGSCLIDIYESVILDPTGASIAHDAVDGWFAMPIPEPTPPKAVITTPAPDEYFYVCDTIYLDGSDSVAGTATLPDPHSCPIIKWTWYIDVGCNGTDLHDFILTGPTNSSHCDAPVDVCINLTVYAPDPQPEYWPYDSVKICIHQVVRPVGAVLDVYTQRGGEKPTAPSDAFGPQELVILFAKVTYNNDSVQNKLVAFEVKDPNMTVVVTRTAATDQNGIATTSFRIPWPCENATQLFGLWTIYASVDIAQQKADDYCKFQFGWLIEILSVKTTDEMGIAKTSFKKCTMVYFVVTIKNIRKISLPVTITIVIYDNCGVPIGIVVINMMVPPGEADVVVIIGIHVVKWAFIGLSTVYVNAYTKMPQLCGVPYCPEVPATITLEKA